MAKDSFDESKNTKKKVTKKKTEEKKPQSSSVTKPKATTTKADKVASKSTFLGGGAPVQKVEQAVSKPKAVKKPASQKKQTVTKQDQINQKMYGTTKPNVTTKTQRTKRDTKPVTSSQRKANAEANMNLKQRNIRDTAPVQSRREIAQAMKSGDYDRASQLRGEAKPGSRRARYEQLDRNISNRVTNAIKNPAPNDRDLNLKQTAAEASRRRAKTALNKVDDAARNLTDRANRWERENLSARNPMLETQRTVKNQKVGEHAAERFQERFERQEPSERQKAFTDYTSGVIQRKALGYAKTASDLLKTNEGYKAQGRWAQEDPEFARKISSHEFAQRADKAFNDYSVKQEEVQKRLNKIEDNASGAGKIALQAYGSGIEMGIDRLAGPMWAASMFASAYGNQRGQALKEGASDEQDARAAFLGAGVEVATEYMFKPVAGIASKFGGKHSLDFAGKLAAKVTGKLTGNKARIADIAIRTLGSQVEEGLEEVAGWAVNPYIQNAAYKNDLQKQKTEEAHADYNDMQQSFWNQFDTEEEAQQAALYVNSDEFIDDQVKTYKESGATDEEARSMARILQKYFLAHFDNDEEAAEEAEAEMDRFVVGDIREKHDWKELGQTLASTFLLTGVTGGASVYYTNQIGKQMLQGEVGKDRVKQYTDIVIKYDPDNAKDAKYVKDTIDNGGTPTGTQVYQVASQATEVLQDMSKREMASDQVKQRRMRDEDLQVAPVVMTARGPQFNEMTGKAYQASYDKALGVVRGVRKHGTDVGLSEEALTSPETMRTAAHAVAAYETGTITAEQINDLTIDNPEVRTIFELATGVDLAQYNVMKRGKIDEIASNNAMMNGLLANAADNYVQMARAEQKQWSNRTRGRMLNAMSNSFGEKGNLAMHDVLKAVDPRDQQKYLLTARIAQNVYDYARRTDISWDKMKNAYKGSFRNVDIDVMKDVYDAAKMDKDKAETAYLGRQVVAGEAMRFEKSDNGVARVTGEFTNDSARELTGEEDEAMRAVADRLGVNIRIVPDSEMTIDGRMSAGENAENVPHFNGSYDSGTNTILLAETNGLNDNILYAMSHETTHLLKQYAPDAYMKLSNYIMDKYYKNSPGRYEAAIKAKQDLYKRVANQDLSEEAALEEIIADATRDFWSDPEFVNQISNDIEEPGFFKSIVNAIRDMLRHIRNLLSSGHFDGTEHEDVLWDLLGTYSKAEKLWLDAYRQAARNRAQMAIDELQEEANKYSIPSTNDVLADRDDTAIFIKNTADADYIDMIFNGEKTEETRTRRTLDAFIGKEVAVTDGKQVYGTVVLGEPHKYSAEEFRSEEAQAKHRVPVGDTYDSANGKWAYPIESYERFDEPMTLSESKDYLGTRQARQMKFSISDADINEIDQTNSIVEDDNGDAVAKFQDNGSVSFSISSYENEGRKIYKDYLDKLVNDKELSQEEANQMLNELETIYNISKRFADSGRFEPYTAWSYADVVRDAKGRPVFSSIRKNSEYKMNIDFSTICKKRRTLDAVFREMIRRGMFEKLDLNKDESAAMVVNINNLIRKNQFEAACALCFVEARRYRQQQTAKTFTNMWNELVESMYSDKDKIAYFNFGRDEQVQDVPDGIHTMDDSQLDLSHVRAVAEELNDKGKPKQTAEAKAARLILNNPEQRKLMRVGDMMASTGFENMQVENPELMKVYNSKKGTGGAKSSFGDVQYLNEIINSKTFDRQKAYDVSGVRIQSFSDYVPRMVFDYVQVIADLAAKKLPAHAYTKEVLFVLQFGLTGAKVNMSLVPDVVADGEAPGLDKDGNYAWNEEGTFPWEDFTDDKGRKWPGARSIQKANGYKENCGTIAVGISDKQIMKMLADPEIQMVIPYHKSSLNPIVAAMTNVDRFTNYEDFQNTKNAEGKTVKTDFAWDKKLFGLTHYTRGEKKGELKPKEKWGNVQDLVKEYVDWCESKNYTPKFSQFLYLKEDNDPEKDFVLDENGNKIINPGYYKMLEDFALMDNDGNFKPQGDVRMQFPTAETGIDGMSMESLIERGLTDDTELEAMRAEKIGGIVDEIDNMFNEGTLTEQSVASQKLAKKFSISPEMDDAYMNAVNSGNMEEAQRLVNEAAKMAGYTERVYHGTGANFTVFDINKSGNNHGGYSMFGKGFYFSDSEAVANAWGKDRKLMHTFIRLENPYVASDDITEGPLFDAFTELRNKWGFPKKDTLDGILAFETLNEQYGYDYTTNLLKAAGYDGVVYTHPKSSGRKAGTKEYIVFDAENIKSADPVTYDIGYKENGNRTKSVIPLSERFDPNNNDIRYSLPTQDSDGNILTDGQMEYFKNSQARDEQGRLVPVYHATDMGGFTIFDPMKSDDHRSLFFSNRRDVAKTYAYNGGDAFDFAPKQLNDWNDLIQYGRQLFSDADMSWDNDTDDANLDFELHDKETGNFADIGYDEWLSLVESNDPHADDYRVKISLPYNNKNGDTETISFEGDSAEDLLNKVSNGNIPHGGHYQVYLNLENPMVIDGKGANWDSISINSRMPNTAHLEIITDDYLDTVAESDEKSFFNEKKQMKDRGYDYKDNQLYFWDRYQKSKQNRKDAEKAREKNIVYIKTETGERLEAEYSLDGIAKAISDYYGFEEAYPEGVQIAMKMLENIGPGWNGHYYMDAGELRQETGETHTTREWAAIAQAEGYDGVIFRNIIDIGTEEYYASELESDIYVAFSSNQVKDINNENPTADNPDIRYSIPDEDMVKKYIEQNVDDIHDIPLVDFMLEQNRQNLIAAEEAFQANVTERWNRKSEAYIAALDDPQAKASLRSIMREVRKNSGTKKQYKSETLEEVLKDIKQMHKYARASNAEMFAKTAWEAAEKIIDDIDYNDDLYEKYVGVKKYLDKARIVVPEEYFYMQDFAEFARSIQGFVRFYADGISLEKAYGQLAKKYPDLFPSDVNNAVDMLMQIADVIDYTIPYRETYTSEEYSDLVEEVASNLCALVENGKDYKTTIEKLKVDAMNQRHQEALRKAEARHQEQLDESNARTEAQRQRAEKWKQRYNDRVQKGIKDRKERSEKEDHRKYFTRIQKNYKKLCDWVLKPTKEKNVPEEFRKSLAEFLQTLDLQTENSKKLEAKTGHVGQKTLKLRELKDRLNALAKSKTTEDGDYISGGFEIDAYAAHLLDILSDKYDGKSVDELDALAIRDIDVVLKTIIKNIQRYKQVKTETKMAEISDVGGRGVEFLKAKIDRDGPYSKRKGAPGALQTINATTLTPPYLFERLGPIKEMYDALRHNGFDTYIRNEKMIIDRLAGILGKYNKTNRKGQNMPGSIVEEWRDERSAQTIQLTYGSVTMSVAQMMSLYCLSKRGEQALGHMLVGGIKTTPIQTTSKIAAEEKEKMSKAARLAKRTKNAAGNYVKSRFKGETETAEKLVLTYDDVQTIISKLTPDQKDVADKLQNLMSVDMARLGNEAHRELYGYEMFDEDFYFPIKVDSNQRETDINTIGEVFEKIKSFGFAKPLTPNANKAIIIDDIFSIVADHCNGMNLYNSYLVPITDFMKVLNYTHTFEDGTTLSMKDAIEQAYGSDMLKYVLNLMKDINGIKAENRGGLEGLMNKAIGRAKKTAVFGNVRVALQQPTAIVRAAAEINPKYLKGVNLPQTVASYAPIARYTSEAMKEMWKYCPIAQWKAWGYYDTYMGKDIEDVMMNNWSIGDDILSGYYGQLDNATWAVIWQAVKAEQADKYPDMDHNSEEFLQRCGRRASEVFDKTQVVDSTFHRSDAMRNKQVAVKLFTAFMAEPTLTLNVMRAGLFNASEEKKAGNKSKAAKILLKTLGIYIAQGVLVSAAQAVADAWRGKDPGLPWGDDDDDEEKAGYWLRWYHNFIYNCFGQGRFWENMYLVKDVTPYINYMISKGADYWNWDPTVRAVMGWDQDYLYSQNNLVFSALENTANGVAQSFKKLEKGDEYVDYNTKEPKRWYDINQKVASGIGSLLGIPAGTLLRDFKPIWDKLTPAVFAADTELMDAIANKMGYKPIEGSSRNTSSDNTDKTSVSTSDEGSGTNVPTRESLPDNLTDEQKADIIKSAERRSKTATAAEDVEKRDYDTMLYDAMKAASGYEGEKYNKKIWESVSKGYKAYVEEGNYERINMMRRVVEEAGGDLDYFDKQVNEASKTALKKSIKSASDMTEEEYYAQKSILGHLRQSGMTDGEISEYIYKSDARTDLQVAMRINDEDAIFEELTALVNVGFTQQDFEKAYKNRNRVNLKNYKDKGGKYSDRLKSMGTFIWPTDGVITSHFGYRNAPTAGASSNHPAIDIGAPQGTAVVAADGGVVISAGANGGYGNSVGIKHDNGMITWYNHLYDWNVKVGDTVAQGQQIAQVGSTGISTGPHLDFKIMDTDGNPVDPEKYLEAR